MVEGLEARPRGEHAQEPAQAKNPTRPPMQIFQASAAPPAALDPSIFQQFQQFQQFQNYLSLSSTTSSSTNLTSQAKPVQGDSINIGDNLNYKRGGESSDDEGGAETFM